MVRSGNSRLGDDAVDREAAGAKEGQRGQGGVERAGDQQGAAIGLGEDQPPDGDAPPWSSRAQVSVFGRSQARAARANAPTSSPKSRSATS